MFQVTNKGAIAHTFEICTHPTKTGSADKCVGKVTKKVAPGASATLTVT